MQVIGLNANTNSADATIEFLFRRKIVRGVSGIGSSKVEFLCKRKEERERENNLYIFI